MGEEENIKIPETRIHRQSPRARPGLALIILPLDMLKISLLVARLVADSAQTMMKLRRGLAIAAALIRGTISPWSASSFRPNRGKGKCRQRDRKLPSPMSKRPHTPAVSPAADVQYSESLIEYREVRSFQLVRSGATATAKSMDENWVCLNHLI